VIDIARDLKLSALITAQNKLGAINHTLLTIEALKKRKINILGIIFNSPKKEDEQIMKDNPSIIKRFSGERVFGALPWTEDYDALYKSFMQIGNKIYRTLDI